MAGSNLKHLRIFESLCGEKVFGSCILTTTMWDLVDDKTGSNREQELREKYWKAMIDQGCAVVRYHNTSASAWDILDRLL